MTNERFQKENAKMQMILDRKKENILGWPITELEETGEYEYLKPEV